MLSLGPLAFLNGWILAGLIALPALWWLLRVTPPAPRRMVFPAVRLLFRLPEREDTPARTPLWILLLRICLAALVILAAAHPLLDPQQALRGGGPLVVVIDDDWAAARFWNRRVEAAAALIDGAGRENRPVRIVTTAPAANGDPADPGQTGTAADARVRLAALTPQPWEADRGAMARALGERPLPEGATIVWMTSGVAGRETTGDATFAGLLAESGDLRILRDPPQDLARLMAPPEVVAGGFRVRVTRPLPGPADRVAIQAITADGRVTGRGEIAIPAGGTGGAGTIRVPPEQRGEVSRLSIEGEGSAGAVALLDGNWLRRPAGIVSNETEAEAATLLGDRYYLDRAVPRGAGVRHGTLDQLLEQDLAVILLADTGPTTPEQRGRLERWIDNGGVLVRFAGPELAAGSDDLLPVRLRQGDRTFGGAMSWGQPAGLAPFPDDSPFSGLEISDEVVVYRQVLAEPGPDLAGRIWARLTDGTPLVTAEARDRGHLVLFHTTADTEWSNLALSGLFVSMLERIAGFGRGVATTAPDVLLLPLESLDGLGRQTEPAPGTQAIDGATLGEARPGPGHPPGYYGTAEFRRAYNLVRDDFGLAAFAPWPSDATMESYGGRAAELDLRPWLLLAALGLLLADFSIGFRFSAGAIPGRARVLPLILLATLLAVPGTGRAETVTDELAIQATGRTTFAWVITGDAATDDISRAGLRGLGEVLRQRTAVEPGPPVGVDPATDELAFYPLLYWPLTPAQAPLSAESVGRLSDYLRHGGLILFDTRDHRENGPGSAVLQGIARNLGIPALEPVPPNHVLTRSFYLIQQFPGRWDGGAVWVRAAGATDGDGVSPVVIGHNDWAAAWAVDERLRPMFATVPGGEQQREYAYRFGINLIMYALTGNYKADQVHIPTIIERLGQ